MLGKKKRFRILPIICGLFTLFLSMFSKIPLSFITPLLGYPVSDISLEFLTVGTVQFFAWGSLDSGIISTNFNNISIADSIPFIFWLITLLAGLFLFMSSSYMNKPKNMKKLMAISLFFLVTELIYHLTHYFILIYSGGTVSLGNGVYYLSSLIILIFIAFLRVTDYHFT